MKSDSNASGFNYPKPFDPRIIRLSQGKFAVVDGIDFEWLNQWKWCAVFVNKLYWYAVRHTPGSHKLRHYIFMHRFLLNAVKGIQVDHRNHNGLDNTRGNLRPCTVSQNQQNRKNTRGASRFKGVSWKHKRNKWYATIWVNKRHLTLGYFDNEIDAAKAYNKAAEKHFGEFACLNVLPS